MKHVLRIISLAFLALFIHFAKANSEFIMAKSCYVIKVQEGKQFMLSAYFDRFSKKIKLTANKKSPWVHVYEGSGHLILLEWYMGRREAIASLFGDKKVDDFNLNEKFERFISEVVLKNFDVIRCDQVEGMGPTELRR